MKYECNLNKIKYLLPLISAVHMFLFAEVPDPGFFSGCSTSLGRGPLVLPLQWNQEHISNRRANFYPGAS